jgi:hypothetical protein
VMVRKQRPSLKRRVLQRPSVIDDADSWYTSVLASVLELLEDEADGHTCITTPDGRACEVTVRFSVGGAA